MDEWRCVGPLVELIRWRDEKEQARIWKADPITPAELAALERQKVAEAVAVLRPRRRACELTWSFQMHQPPDNPGLRLREEALLQVLELPPRDYPIAAVGWAGVTVSGRVPTAAPGP